MNYKFINGIKIYAPMSRKSLIRYSLKKNALLVAINAEKIMNADNLSKKIINQNIGYPDGLGAVIALKKSGLNNIKKIPGCELWLDIIQMYHADKKFYLIGGKNSVIKDTVSKLRNKFKGIDIVNYRCGYFNHENETEELIEDIIDKKPDIVFVAMGSPAQELMMNRIKQKHSALYQGLGGSFDIYSDRTKRAPNWFIKNNLEWLYRLLREPMRIFRQIKLIKFIILLILGRYSK